MVPFACAVSAAHSLDSQIFGAIAVKSTGAAVESCISCMTACMQLRAVGGAWRGWACAVVRCGTPAAREIVKV